jgi:hypothetical protein
MIVVSWIGPESNPGTGLISRRHNEPAGLIQKDFAPPQGIALRDLSKSCQEGVESLVQLASFQESVKAVVNAERVEKLTKLATIFLPRGFHLLISSV